MKLYRCTIEVVYYAMAENRRDAEGHVRDAVHDMCIDEHVDAVESDGSRMLSDDWDERCLVYHNGKEDITMAQAMKKDHPPHSEKAQ